MDSSPSANLRNSLVDSLGQSFKQLKQLLADNADFHAVHAVLKRIADDTSALAPVAAVDAPIELVQQAAQCFDSQLPTVIEKVPILLSGDKDFLERVVADFRSVGLSKIAALETIAHKALAGLSSLMDQRSVISPVSSQERAAKEQHVRHCFEEQTQHMMNNVRHHLVEFLAEENQKVADRPRSGEQQRFIDGSNSNSNRDGDNARSKKLPAAAVEFFKTWLVEHMDNPYPTEDQKTEWSRRFGISTAQCSNWFINARVRTWRPLMKRQNNGKVPAKLAKPSQQEVLQRDLETQLQRRHDPLNVNLSDEYGGGEAVRCFGAIAAPCFRPSGRRLGINLNLHLGLH